MDWNGLEMCFSRFKIHIFGQREIWLDYWPLKHLSHSTIRTHSYTDGRGCHVSCWHAQEEQFEVQYLVKGYLDTQPGELNEPVYSLYHYPGPASSRASQLFCFFWLVAISIWGVRIWLCKVCLLLEVVYGHHITLTLCCSAHKSFISKWKTTTFYVMCIHVCLYNYCLQQIKSIDRLRSYGQFGVLFQWGCCVPPGGAHVPQLENHWSNTLFIYRVVPCFSSRPSSS